MKQYIVNLTDDLIKRHRLCEVYCEFNSLASKPDFIVRAKGRIAASICRMNPCKLGEILGDIENGEVIASKEELLLHVTYRGNMLYTFQDLVAAALAYAVHSRLGPASVELGFPPFRK
jgi:hypothetical protein